MKKFISTLLLLSCLAYAADVPDVKVNTSFTGQISSDNTVTLFTPTETGVYRVSVYIEFSSSIGTTTAIAEFTGSKGSTSAAATCSNVSSTNAAQCTILIRSLASDPVSLEVITGNPTPNYDMYVFVEHLN